MVRGNVNVSAGNPRISNMPHVQRGQWKKGLVERVPWRSDFNDPVDPNLGRRKQESRYWCLINLNKTVGDHLLGNIWKSLVVAQYQLS